MTTLKDLENEINKIKERNRRVEADKAWEMSLSRKILIFILTYFVIVLFFLFAGLPNPFINSLVPAIAFALSTLTLSIFKKLWLRYIYKRRLD
jgi:preprotein translocase subunit SecF